MEELVKRYQLSKVVEVIAGGTTGQLSIFNGLECAKKHFSANSTVLIHDGVRPLINHDIITANIEQVKRSGNAITTSPTIETFRSEEHTSELQSRPHLVC